MRIERLYKNRILKRNLFSPLKFNLIGIFMLKKYYIFIALIIIFLINGCNKTDIKNNINNKRFIKLVKVNNHIITTQILGKRGEIFKQLDKRTKKKIIEKLVNDEILIQYIFDKNKTYSDIKDENKRAKVGLLLLSRYFVSSTEEINNTTLFKLYKKNKKKYWHDSLVEISHIVVKDENEANKILNKLTYSKDFNKTFISICKSKSIDKRTSMSGGYLGRLKSTLIPKSIKEAIDKLNSNQYTKKPIKTKSGYEIIYLHSKLPKGYFSFKDVKNSIFLKTTKDKMNKWATKKLNKLKKDVKITYLYK
jgi:parvulin-like peptidyl-prolyl isomerase